MATNETVYRSHESAAVVVLIVCSGLSFISVLGIFVVLGVSLGRSHRSSDKTVFVRTHVATYFVSLLICNFVQGVGGLMNIPWIVANGVYSGVVCTAQGVIKQLGNVGTAIFCFVIAVHTFSLLFLCRQWSARTCRIVLIVSWALLLLELCIEGFVLADPEIGPYFGVAGYWCWITPAYPIERYATSYLFMIISAGLSLILYMLVFFRLRGNITISGRHKISFHRRPKIRVGRTSDGTYVITDDQRVESHLTRIAKHMLWYPIAYIVIILPQAASRFSTFSGAPVPFFVVMFTAAVFMLHGFINTVLFCTTRNILPGRWRQRLRLGSAWDSGRNDFDLSSRMNATWSFAGLGARTGTVGTGSAPVVLSVGVEKDVEVKYDKAQTCSGFSSPLSPLTPSDLLQAYDVGQERADARKDHTRQLSFQTPQDATTSIRIGLDSVNDDHVPGRGVHPASKAKTMERGMPTQLLGRAPRGHGHGVFGPAPGLGELPSVHLFSTTPPAGTADRRQTCSPYSSTLDGTINPGHLSQTSGEL